MARKSKFRGESMTPEKLRQIQELRRSGATRYTDKKTRADEKRRAIEESE